MILSLTSKSKTIPNNFHFLYEVKPFCFLFLNSCHCLSLKMCLYQICIFIFFTWPFIITETRFMDNIKITEGKFESYTIEFTKGEEVSSVDQPAKTLSSEELKTKFLQHLKTVFEKAKYAVFVRVPECYLSLLSPVMQEHGFYMHHIEEQTLVYATWRSKTVENKIPEYATSTEGVGALILSPDLLKVLLVFEYGKWKLVTGNVERKERILDALKREISEEVHVTLNDQWPPVYLGGWSQAAVEPYRKVNNNFMVFAVQATSMDFKVDNFEIKQAKWFSIDDLWIPKLLTLAELQNLKIMNAKEKTTFATSSVEFNKTDFSCMAMLMLNTLIYFKTEHSSTTPGLQIIDYGDMIILTAI